MFSVVIQAEVCSFSKIASSGKIWHLNINLKKLKKFSYERLQTEFLKRLLLRVYWLMNAILLNSKELNIKSGVQHPKLEDCSGPQNMLI